MTTNKRREGPWRTPPFEAANAYAVQALARGTASAAQQQLALAFIVKGLCETDRMTFWPPREHDCGRRATDFAEGKRWVGLEIRRLLLPVPGAPMKEPREDA